MRKALLLLFLILAGTETHALQQEAVSFRFLSSWPGVSENRNISSIQVTNGYAYIGQEDRFEILDVRNPVLPSSLGYCITAMAVRGLQVAGEYAFLAEVDYLTQTNDLGRLEVVDISDPANPNVVGEVDLPGPAKKVRVVGDYAYVAMGSRWTGSNMAGGLEIFDVRDRSHPLRVGNYESASSLLDVQLNKDFAYVADGTNDLLVLDVSNPANPIYAGSYYTNLPPSRYGGRGIPSSLVLIGGYVYAAGDGLQILDVKDPKNPIRLGGSSGLNIFNLCYSGHLLYFSYDVPGGSGPIGFVVVMDVTDAVNPVVVGIPLSNTVEVQTAFAVAGNYAFITGYHGLTIFEVMELPYVRSIARNLENIVITWNATPGVKLQSKKSLADPEWNDVPGSDGQSSVSIAASGSSKFFRLVKAQ
jgi:hypothetical protein